MPLLCSSCGVSHVVHISVVTWRLIPMVSLTMENPQLLPDMVVDVPVVLVVRVHRCRLHLVRKLVAGSP